ncbi:hypothetical protein V1477_020600 [Vespula maculifrons]|uniref:Uncharacterized protein n=1 Tax=Vespula maculifrons TaxID=7453 RepID=A0ABD2APH4_VESMC
MVAGFAIFMKYRYPKNLVGCSRSDTIWFLDKNHFSFTCRHLAPAWLRRTRTIRKHGNQWIEAHVCLCSRLTQSATVCDEERSIILEKLRGILWYLGTKETRLVSTLAIRLLSSTLNPWSSDMRRKIK